MAVGVGRGGRSRCWSGKWWESVLKEVLRSTVRVGFGWVDFLWVVG